MNVLNVISKLVRYPIRSLVQKDELAFVISVSVEREEFKFYILNDLHKMIYNMKAVIFCNSPRMGGLLSEKTNIWSVEFVICTGTRRRLGQTQSWQQYILILLVFHCVLTTPSTGFSS